MSQPLSELWDAWNLKILHTMLYHFSIKQVAWNNILQKTTAEGVRCEIPIFTTIILHRYLLMAQESWENEIWFPKDP